MTNWTTKRLADISTTCLGKMLDKKKNKGDYQPYLANLNVQWGEFKLHALQEMRFEKHEQERFGLKYGDLIICEGGEPGRCAVWRDEVPNMKVQKALHRLRVNSGFNSDFLYYRMKLAGKNKELDRHFIGTTIKHLTGIGLKGVEFDFPPHREQELIAKTLRILDEKIELNNKINAELEAMAKLIYDYWFVQFDFPDANGKPYKSSGGKMTYNQVLKREIPDGWEVKSFGDYAKVKSGFAFKSSWWQASGIPVVKIKDIQENNTLNQSDLSFVSEDKIRAASRFISKVNDVVIAMTGATIGKFAIIPKSDKPLLINQRVGLYDLGENPIAKLPFLINSMKQDFFRNKVFQVAGGAAQPNISGEQLDNLPLIYPNNGLLEKYNSLMLSNYQKYSNNEAESSELVKLRDWLLPMLMNGQVTVKDA